MTAVATPDAARLVFAAVAGLILLLILIWLIRFIHRHHRKRIKAPNIPPTKKRNLR